MQCGCGSTTNLRKLDIPATWGVEYICKACDDYYDTHWNFRPTSAHQDVTPSRDVDVAR